MESRIKNIFAQIRAPEGKVEDKAFSSRAGKHAQNQNSNTSRKSNPKGGKFKEALSTSISNSEFSDLHGKSMNLRITKDGYKVYSEEMFNESLAQSGGDSSLCPFDCKCCF